MHDPSERFLSPPAYITVFVILAVLTVLTVGLSFLPSSAVARLVAGQGIAAVKASLVVLFFMHALHSPVQTRAAIAVTVFWFLLLLSLTLSDYFTRGLIPNLPGH
jgi:cytochrome c oxidase subunit IV